MASADQWTEYKSLAFTAVDTFPMMKVWYDGPYDFAKFDNPTTDLKGWADDTDGATTVALWGVSGVLDTTDALYSSYGESCDMINAHEATGWHCRLVGAERADLLYSAATVRTAIDIAGPTTCKDAEIEVYDDSSAYKNASNDFFFSVGLTNEGLHSDNWGSQIELLSYSVILTFAADAPTIKVYDVDDDNKTAGAEIFSVLSAATTVNQTKIKGVDWDTLITPVGHRMILRCDNVTVMTAPTINVQYAIHHRGPKKGSYISIA
ncbi:MAG: hypothetical protein KKB31_07500 [Nanoarchaeota archaeon]|nr:hypothetical protein [Nanoarchaeota archaeon]